MAKLHHALELRGEPDTERKAAWFCASTEEPVATPWGREVLLLSGLRLARFRANPVVLDAHNRGRIGDIVGRAEVKVDREAGELLVLVHYAPTPSGQEAWELVRGGFLRAMSVGYAVNPKRVEQLREGEEREGIQGPALLVREWELHEVSNVPVPADEKALRRDFYAASLRGELPGWTAPRAKAARGPASSGPDLLTAADINALPRG